MKYLEAICQTSRKRLDSRNDLSLTANFMTRYDMDVIVVKRIMHEESGGKSVKIWHGSDCRKMYLWICDDTKFSPFCY